MPSGSHEHSDSYRGYRIHIVALRYGGQHDGWWTLRAGVWLHGHVLPDLYPDSGVRFACATDARRAGLAWGRELIDRRLASQHAAEEAAFS
ncbi:hypothetical protein CupriaWKF_27805 [Cupriavidus sp. WKF15]|uniref:hypothetical protein n=1 Tax=Cupriavidus sp. WKF15 TaxID=3032282 RepID=UPI0023E0D4D3|nr:hypothetical protein [Cupriavidus sp. WKF15]WER48586.1 hypothetical protein CupriaWKF_27805 [Cupriavidus sp. WKF15]